MHSLLRDIRACRVCEPHLDHGVNPILAAHTDNRIAIIGQAPGRKVHRSGIAWQDASGDRLREWLDISAEEFYDTEKVALIPMGFCYPGKGKSGDLPPRPECAPLWHDKLLQRMKHLKCTLVVGAYAQKYYLGEDREKNLTETVRNFKAYQPDYFPLPHPSPRNNIWLKKNSWFEAELVPELRRRVRAALS